MVSTQNAIDMSTLIAHLQLQIFDIPFCTVPLQHFFATPSL